MASSPFKSKILELDVKQLLNNQSINQSIRHFTRALQNQRDGNRVEMND
jgi:hypothetical protein